MNYQKIETLKKVLKQAPNKGIYKLLGRVEVPGELVCITSKDKVIKIKFKSKNFEDKDFDAFIKPRLDIIEQWFHYLIEQGHKEEEIIINAKWIGKDIVPNRISKLDKMLLIEAVGIKSPDKKMAWFDENLFNFSYLKALIFDVRKYAELTLNIDLANLGTIPDQLKAIDETVKEECPFSYAFKVQEPGGNMIWRINFNNTVHRFKL